MIPVCVQPLLLLEQLVQIERAVDRQVDPALDELFRRQMHRIHQFPEHLQIFVLQIDKIAVFQPVIFLVQLVAFQHVEQLLPADVLRVDLQIEQAARHRHADRHAHLPHDVQTLERVRAAHLPKLGQPLHTAVEHLIDAVLLTVAAEQIALFIGIWEDLFCEKEDLTLTPFQTKALIIGRDRI